VLVENKKRPLKVDIIDICKTKNQQKGISMEQHTKSAQEIINELMPEKLTDKVSLFLHFAEPAKVFAEGLMQSEVEEKTEKKYSREHGSEDAYDRWGRNPGSLRIGDERVRVGSPGC
jgi:hypothetical protein